MTSLPIANGILRCCNQFPRRYKNIDAMAAELPELAKLGFNAVWINPIHATGKHRKLSKQNYGSLYAIADHWQIKPEFSVIKRDADGTPTEMSADEAFEQDKTAIKRYTAEARKLGMIPMFDLVLVHAAIDSSLVSGTHPRYQGEIDTSRWFKRHANGRVIQQGLDAEGNINDKKVWDDVAPFNYDNPAIADEIFQHLWKPYLDMYIEELGFQGVRVDALASTPPEILKRALAYLDAKCREVHGVAPVILGETLGQSNEHIPNYVEKGFTHVTNLCYWTPTETGPNLSADKRTGVREMWRQGGAWFSDNMGSQQQIVHCDARGKPIPGRLGGTVGFCSFHDGPPWSRQLVNHGLKGARLEQGMREKMAMAALASDAGWFMPAGDMQADKRKYHVFDEKNEETPQPQCDMRPFIKELNAILAKMPPTQWGSWPERLFLDSKPDLLIIKRHNGYGDSGQTSLILVNTNPEKEISISPTELVDIAQLTDTPVLRFSDPEKNGIYYCGEINMGMSRPLVPYNKAVERVASRTDVSITP